MKLVFLTLSLLIAGSAFAGVTFPEKYTDFSKVSFEDMKKYPDVKWPLEKKVSAADMKDKTETELILMRNSIFAQYGFRFSEKGLANYFLGRTWYKPVHDWSNGKVSSISKENITLLLTTLATTKQPGRAIASEDSYVANQVAYNLFLMGFCTYDVGSEKKAGLVVFEPGGAAKVFHSQASRSQYAPYAYDGYASFGVGEDGKPSNEFGSLMIDATWKVKVMGNKASVRLNYPKESVSMFRDENGKQIIAAGEREVLSVKVGQYGFVNARSCTMTIVK